MPGIHLRSSGKNDCIKREQEPILTVPGSYWLCHKSYIYKFTFRYHKSSKTTKEFSNGKELMKVIRRIIKSQPRQGQQFGTRHLLVTYNSSSWTRQDKMFAMLKFRDRKNATAFSRAFVLTVKLLATEQMVDSVTEYNNHRIAYDKNSKSTWDGAKTNGVTGEMSRKTALPASITLDESSSDVSMKFTSLKPMQANGNASVKFPTPSERPKKPNSASFFADMEDLPLLERYILEQRDEQELLASPKTDPLGEIQETVDMPYQYLIEREIERSKISLDTPNFRTRKVIPSERASHVIDNAMSRSADITDLVMEGLMFTIRQNEDSISVVEQKTKLEPDEVLENSEKIETSEGAECLVNSSLLKLENLITKIEMSASNAKTSTAKVDNAQDNLFTTNNFDEMQSSISNLSHDHENLLKATESVEKMILDSDSDESKINESDNISEKMIPIQACTANPEESSLNAVDPLGPSPNVELNGEPMEMDKTHSDLEDGGSEVEDEEEDIVPEAFRKTSSNFYPDKSPPFAPNNPDESNLLMDDSEESANSPKDKSTMPRIVSTEVVKYDLTVLRSSRTSQWPDKPAETPENPEIDGLPELKSTLPIIDESMELKHIPRFYDVQESIRDAPIMTRRRSTVKRKLDEWKFNDDREIAIEKFLQDMTYGVRVVLQRLDLSGISNAFGKRFCSTNCIN